MLITQKQRDFLLWKCIIQLMNKKEHLNIEGLNRIIKLKASLNWGLSNKLKLYFPNIIKEEKPKINLTTIINPYWFAGFFQEMVVLKLIYKKIRFIKENTISL